VESHADPARDRLAFGVITHAMGKKMPILGICRGLQELVVANGGALHRYLHLTHQFQEHREDDSLPLEQQYAPVHEVKPEADGLLSQLLGSDAAFAVNSLHQQGIREPGPQVRIEARAADGLIEAVSLRQHPFALAVQWHPEWHSTDDPVSRRLFEAFIHAAARYHKEKRP